MMTDQDFDGQQEESYMNEDDISSAAGDLI